MSKADDIYIIARDQPEIKRLADQHNIYMQCQGYYLHPTINLPQNARVAELATGTAIWLQQLASQNTSFDCHGFDISDALFPSDLEANLKLHVQDVKSPFNSYWHGQFDAVHIRFLVPAMSVADWAVVLANAVSILRPGGWLQWCENDTYVGCKYAPRGAPPYMGNILPNANSLHNRFIPPRLPALHRLTKDVIPPEQGAGMTYGFLNLGRLMKDPGVGGLADVFVDAYNTDALPHLRKAFTIICIEGVGGVGRKQRDQGDGSFDVETWQRQAKQEVEDGAYLCLRAVVFMGRKPASTLAQSM